jgi:2-oxoglutarate ferredoxin oxidoreductase subunit alpha
MPIEKVFTIKIGGQAGQGIKSAGLEVAKVATRSGYFTYDYSEYPSLIRGGHNSMQIGIDTEPVLAPTKHTNLLIALNQETINLHHQELVDDGGVLFDAEQKLDTSKVKNGVNIFPVPLVKLAREAGGSDLMSNTVAVGAAMALLSGSMEHFKDLLAEEFADKPPEVVQLNHKAAIAGFEFASKNFKDKIKEVLKPRGAVEPKMVVNANDTVALGAIGAGLQFAAIYPMTPTSNILHVLAPLQEEYGFVYKQPEDEISAINMALGAAFAGARSMVATSGGGFALMIEGYGLAGIAELPVVIIEGMRGAPATGMPTWTEQGDLRMVLHAHQGDFPRIVLAAGDAEEAFHLTMKAFNLAEKYQTPVLLLVDKLICEDGQSYLPFDVSGYKIDRGKFSMEKMAGFKRFKMSDDGISLRSAAGTGNHIMANSDEHDEEGWSTEDAEMRIKQMNKRMQKLITCEQQDMEAPQLFGPDDADVTIVSWGSNKGSILQALKDFPNVNYLHMTWMNPFPAAAVRARLEKARYLLGMECNYSGQLMGLIREKTGIDIVDKHFRYDGRPIFPEDVRDKLNNILGR